MYAHVTDDVPDGTAVGVAPERAESSAISIELTAVFVRDVRISREYLRSARTSRA
jgi:hypothetical protein